MQLGRRRKDHNRRAAVRIYANQTCLAECLNCVLNVKALVGAFNQEKALEGAFTVIEKSARTFV